MNNELKCVNKKCGKLFNIMKTPGAIIFSPPDEKDNCKKSHLCPDCYDKLMIDLTVKVYDTTS